VRADGPGLGAAVPKIMICNESLTTGGISTYTLRLASALKDRGWRVRCLVSTFKGDHYREMAEIAEQMTDLTDRRLGFMKARAAADAIRDASPDILLLNHCALAHYALPLLDSRIRPVAVVHADVPLFYRTAARFPEYVFRWVSPSRRLQEGSRAYLPARHQARVAVIAHGVEANPFGRLEESPLEGHPRVLFVGNLGKNKGADLLPEIFERVTKAVPKVSFAVLGRGDLEEMLRADFERRQLSVEMAGHVSPAEVLRTMAASHFLVLPSTGEGFGLVIIEAMRSGVVPVVARHEGGTADIVREGQTGVLIAPRDVAGYAEAIIRLIQHPGSWAAMSRAAAVDARERFSLEPMAKRYEELFAELDDRPAQKILGPVEWRLRSIREHYRGRWRD